MEQKRKEYEEEYFVQNIGLIGCILKRLGINSLSYNYEDLFQEGKIGLLKAVRTFKKENKIKFSTYATVCIRNEIVMCLRRENKHTFVQKLQEPIYTESDGSQITLEDTLFDEKINFLEDIVNKDLAERVIEVILNWEDKNERIISLLTISRLKQKEISDKFNFSQSYVSRLQRKIFGKIKLFIDAQFEYKHNYSIILNSDKNHMTFFINHFKNDKSVLNILNKHHSNSKSNFDIKFRGEKAIVDLPFESSSFLIIEEIIRNIEFIE